MSANMTVIYYTGQYEKPSFEEKIKANILENKGDLPLISISQKPIDFGENICVGEVGKSMSNAFRQMLIGVEAAKTHFVCMAESDILYPRSYFEFRPDRDDTFYIAKPHYTLFAFWRKTKTFYEKPQGSEGVVICGRDILIKHLTELLGDYRGFDAGDRIKESYLWKARSERFKMAVPSVQIKTDRNLHRMCPIRRKTATRTLKYWGTSSEVINRYFSL